MAGYITTAPGVPFTVPSPTKAKAKVHGLMLPKLALEGNTAVLPTSTPSPMSRPICTPQNAASTHWRTVVCPHPPVKRGFHRVKSIDVMSEDSSSGGLVTPANLWPSPAGTPMGTPKAFGFGGYGTPQGVPRTTSLGFGAFGELSCSKSVTPSQSPQFASATPLLLSRAVSEPPPVHMIEEPARLQTISDTSPLSKNDPFAMDVSMEATPSPDRKRVQRMALSSPFELQPSRGPVTPDDKPVLQRSDKFREEEI